MPQIMADNLEADGYRAVCAADTATALELLSATPDALIVDVNGDTLGVIDAIRQETHPAVIHICRSSCSHRRQASYTARGSWSAAPTT